MQTEQLRQLGKRDCRLLTPPPRTIEAVSATGAAQSKAHRRLVAMVAGIDWAVNRWAAQEERNSHSPERIAHARS
jgi:hypothetical protein